MSDATAVSNEESESGPSTVVSEIWERRTPPAWFPRALIMAMIAVASLAVMRSVFSQLSHLLITLLVSLFLSFAAEPAVDAMERRGWRRGAATGVVFLGIAVTAVVLLWVVGSLVVQQVQTLADEAPGWVRDGTEWVNDRFGTEITTDSLSQTIEDYQDDIANAAGDVGGRVISITNSAVGVVFQTFTIALFSFYLVADGPKLRRSICSVLPPKRQRLVLGLWELAIHKTGGYLYSRLLLAAVSAVISWVAFSIIGVPSPLALAVWLGVVSQFVPVIGTYIGGFLPAIVALVDSPSAALWVVAFIIVYQQFENYVLAPRVTARTMDIHPAVAFGSVLAGAAIIGPTGALLALPAAAIIQAFVSSYLQRHDVIESGLLDHIIEQNESPSSQQKRLATLNRFTRSTRADTSGPATVDETTDVEDGSDLSDEDSK